MPCTVDGASGFVVDIKNKSIQSDPVFVVHLWNIVYFSLWEHPGIFTRVFYLEKVLPGFFRDLD